MMKIFLILCLLSQFSQGLTQNTDFVWPVEGKTAGEDILYRPNDYIFSEHNSGGLYLKTIEGASIIAPCNGTITSYKYSYLLKINESISFPIINGSDVEIRETIAKEMLTDYNTEVDPKYINIIIGILTKKNEKYYIRGIRPLREFKTGYPIKKGDIIGTAGYTYKKIKQSCVLLSRSINGMPADPMSPFKLISSFIKPEKLNPKKTLPVEKLKEDFIIFRESLEEGHVGLYDYISKSSLDSVFNGTFNSLNGSMNSEAFAKLLIPIFNKIRDSHTYLLSTYQPSDMVLYPQIFFGWQGDSLIVTRSLTDNEEFIGKRIIEINGIKSESLRQTVKQTLTGADGFIESLNEFNLLCMGWARYFSIYPCPDRIFNVTFSDGSSHIFYLEDKTKNKHLKITPTWNYVSFQKQNFNCQKINDTVAYLDLNTLKLTKKDLDEILSFIKVITDSSYPNLIVDLRNNSGGTSEMVSYLYSLFANKPFKLQLSKKVNKNDTFHFFKYCENYSSETSQIFKEYKSIEGENGYFLPFDSIPWNYPNDSIHFDGKIYMLTNENSLSASGVLAGLIHNNKRGVIVGRETGSTYHQLNAEKHATLKLKNTGLRIRFPLVKKVYHSMENSDIPLGRGVIPDFPIILTLKELEGVNDLILDSTMSLIKHASYKQKSFKEIGKTNTFNLIIITTSIIILLFVIITYKNRKK